MSRLLINLGLQVQLVLVSTLANDLLRCNLILKVLLGSIVVSLTLGLIDHARVVHDYLEIRLLRRYLLCQTPRGVLVEIS